MILEPRLVRLAQKLELPFGALGAIRELRFRLEELEYAAIRSARDKGASWEEIAAALHITRQALQQRMQRHEQRERQVVRLEDQDPASLT